MNYECEAHNSGSRAALNAAHAVAAARRGQCTHRACDAGRRPTLSRLRGPTPRRRAAAAPLTKNADLVRIVHALRLASL